jgi:hypothetical protein
MFHWEIENNFLIWGVNQQGDDDFDTKIEKRNDKMLLEKYHQWENAIDSLRIFKPFTKHRNYNYAYAASTIAEEEEEDECKMEGEVVNSEGNNNKCIVENINDINERVDMKPKAFGKGSSDYESAQTVSTSSYWKDLQEKIAGEDEEVMPYREYLDSKESITNEFGKEDNVCAPTKSKLFDEFKLFQQKFDEKTATYQRIYKNNYDIKVNNLIKDKSYNGYESQRSQQLEAAKITYNNTAENHRYEKYLTFKPIAKKFQRSINTTFRNEIKNRKMLIKNLEGKEKKEALKEMLKNEMPKAIKKIESTYEAILKNPDRNVLESINEHMENNVE